MCPLLSHADVSSDEQSSRNGAAPASQSGNGDVTTHETSSVTSDSHEGDNMSFHNSSTLPSGGNSSANLLASRTVTPSDSPENGHFMTGEDSDGGTSGQSEGVMDPANNRGLLLSNPVSKGLGLRRRPMSRDTIDTDQGERELSD